MTKAMMTLIQILTLSFGLSALAEDKAYDAQFLDKMTEHHRQGLEMARMGKDKAENKDLKRMSDKMVKDQVKEIAQMEKWRETEFAKEPKATDLPPKMDMSPLKSASGAAFDHQYIEMMTKHHDDGITMAKEAQSQASTDKIKSFAQNIVTNQTSEKEKLSKMHSSTR